MKPGTLTGPLPAVPTVAKCQINGNISGRAFVNIFHVQFNTDFLSAAQCTDIAGKFLTLYKTQFANYMASGVQVSNCIVTDLGGATGAQGSSSAGFSGTHSGFQLPNNVALAASWHIGRRYRGGHPRTYFPGQTQSDLQDTMHWSANTLSNWTLAAQGFVTGVVGLGSTVPYPLNLVCVHYVMHKVPQTPPLVDVITSATVHPRIDSQRRRLGKETP